MAIVIEELLDRFEEISVDEAAINEVMDQVIGVENIPAELRVDPALAQHRVDPYAGAGG
jgi:hypothetical protein